MTKHLAILLIGTLALAACDDDDGNGNGNGGGGGGGGLTGIETLGEDFVRVFNQDPNDEPIPIDEITLTKTPSIEPFTL